MLDLTESFQPTTTSLLARMTDVVETIARQHGVRTPIAPTESLVDLGMTSMAMVDLMLAIEVEFDLTLPQPEMTPSNFQSISSLSQMLSRL